MRRPKRCSPRISPAHPRRPVRKPRRTHRSLCKGNYSRPLRRTNLKADDLGRDRAACEDARMQTMKRYNMMIRYAVLVAFALTAAVAAQAQKASTSYRGSARDPFVAWKPAPKKPKKTGPSIVAPPSIQARIDAYKAQKLAAIN